MVLKLRNLNKSAYYQYNMEASSFETDLRQLNNTSLPSFLENFVDSIILFFKRRKEVPTN
jgi:hypothetical protein